MLLWPPLLVVFGTDEDELLLVFPVTHRLRPLRRSNINVSVVSQLRPRLYMGVFM